MHKYQMSQVIFTKYYVLITNVHERPPPPPLPIVPRGASERESILIISVNQTNPGNKLLTLGLD